VSPNSSKQTVGVTVCLNAQAAERIPVEPDVDDLLGTVPAKIKIGSALDNAKEQLSVSS
jgi:hypothetical protein